MANNGNGEGGNAMLYFLAGVGVGALIGAAAGLLLAPRPGAETRADLSHKFDELKAKVQEYIRERRQKKGAPESADEAGA
ncbi:MAG: YtxH domain-containing protein [Armatimonadota bacterium]